MHPITEDSRPPIHITPQWRIEPDRTDAPLSLTASDGTGLTLHRLSARAHVQDPLALTELTLEFDNPEGRELEGRFAITLPPGAAVSRFAMEIGGSWQEGEVVEKQRARRIYEDFLHRAQDPALMEKAPGNRFTARVYPIPPRSRKRIRIAWSQELPSSETPYVLPLQGLPKLENFSVEVTLESFDGTEPQRYTEAHTDHTPAGDLVVSLGSEAMQVGLRSDELLLARLKLDLDAPAEPITALTVLVDTSASQALTLPAAVGRLMGILDALIERGAGGIPLTVVAFDQVCRTVYEGPLSAFDGEGFPEPMGASNLADALAQIRCTDRLLLITDGLPTAGGTTLDALREPLTQTGATRLDALIVGGIRDEACAAGLARGVLACDGVVLDLHAQDIPRRLEQATRSGITVAVAGAAWCWPTTLDGVQPGDEVMVYAALDVGEPARFQITGARPEGRVAIAPVARPLLARAAAQAQIAALSQRASAEPEHRAALTAEIIALSCAHRVLCDHTAMLVLETHADYARYGLARDALADILTIDADGIAVIDDRSPVTREEPAKPAEKGDRTAKKVKKKSVARRMVDRFQGSQEEERSERLDADDIVEDIDEDDDGDFETGAVAGAAESEAMDFGGSAAAEEDEEEEVFFDAALADEAPVAAAEQSAPLTESLNGGGGLPPVDLPAPAPPPTARPRSAPRPASAQAVPEPEVVTSTIDAMPAEPPRSVDRPGLVQRLRRRLAAPAAAPAAKIPARPLPLEGRLKAIHDLIQADRIDAAVAEARAWRAAEPGDVLALLALGRALEAASQPGEAARAYGSLIDLYASRADLRRVAGERLERLEAGQALAVDTFAVAVEQRPDHPSGHRLLAWALARMARWEEAFEALCAGLTAKWPDSRFPGVREVLTGDLALIAAAWAAAEPAREDEIRSRLAEHSGTWPDAPSMRLLLSWETDANDVDLHVYDKQGSHAYYSSKQMPSGGRLLADVTTGYGPECFTVDRPAAFPYRVQAHYYRRGPMGYGTGTLQVVRHDGAGGLQIEARPFVIMVDDGWIDLGEVVSR